MNQINPVEIIILTPPQLETLISQVFEKARSQPETKEEEAVFLEMKEVQKFLKVGRTTIHNYIKTGKLRPVRIGRKLLFKKSDLLKNL